MLQVQLMRHNHLIDSKQQVPPIHPQVHHILLVHQVTHQPLQVILQHHRITPQHRQNIHLPLQIIHLLRQVILQRHPIIHRLLLDILRTKLNHSTILQRLQSTPQLLQVIHQLRLIIHLLPHHIPQHHLYTHLHHQVIMRHLDIHLQGLMQQPIVQIPC